MIEKPAQKYEDGVKEASKPAKERETCFRSRTGCRQKPRRHHLVPEDQERLLVEIKEKGKFVSPFGKFRVYDGLISSLSNLGENKNHSVKEVMAAFEEYMSQAKSKDKSGRTAWDRYFNKAPRSQVTGKDEISRLLQNVNVLQRIGGLHPYALKLAQLGSCVDVIKGEDGSVRLSLRTGIPHGDNIIPKNEMKKRNYKRPSGVEHLISCQIFLPPTDKI